jgi:hypothetical protein
MNNEFADTPALLGAVTNAGAAMRNQIALLDEALLNTVPFEGSWSAGELVSHVSKATAGLARALGAEGTPADRAPDERIAGLKQAMADFETKMKSPEFILPDAGPFQKERSMAELDAAFAAVHAAGSDAGLNELVSGLPMGPVTKLELIHFVLYHTERHNQQLQRIVGKVAG